MNCGVNASLLLNVLVLENPPTIEDEDENDDEQCY